CSAFLCGLASHQSLAAISHAPVWPCAWSMNHMLQLCQDHALCRLCWFGCSNPAVKCPFAACATCSACCSKPAGMCISPGAVACRAMAAVPSYLAAVADSSLYIMAVRLETDLGPM
ncbi:hypothetical protein COO60DRAFT_1545615, partial [Scenedesmus sp. NREL 46B-D3]